MEKIISALKKLTNHNQIGITLRGNAAIESAFSLVPAGGKVLIPEEGGWLTYKSLPPKMKLTFTEVKCDDAKINLADLQQKLQTKDYALFLYQNPGGYFAEQPMKEIYNLCHQNNCLTVVDVSGSIGTKLCDGKYADILVDSFGKWKLVEAGIGGFISCKDKELFNKLKIKKMDDEHQLTVILDKLNILPERIKFLTEKRKKIINDLKQFNVVHRNDLGFVVIVKFLDNEEKEKIINYCTTNHLEWTECPRYIRLNQNAISIEVKRLQR